MESNRFTHDIDTAFQSARLQYLRADATNPDYKAVISQFAQDPVIHMVTSPAMLQPKQNSEIDEISDDFASSLLGVAICLLPDEKAKLKPQGSGDATIGNADHPTMIGVMAIGRGGVDPSLVHHRTAEISTRIAPAYQNRGYGREAIGWMIDRAFKHGALHSVSVTATSLNPRAIHVYEELGFRLEGRRREVWWFNRGWHDDLEFGMTEQEWEKLRGVSGVASR